MQVAINHYGDGMTSIKFKDVNQPLEEGYNLKDIEYRITEEMYNELFRSTKEETTDLSMLSMSLFSMNPRDALLFAKTENTRLKE